MPIFICNKCSKQFDHRSKYNRHLERIRSCTNRKNISGSKTSKNIIDNKCKHCKRDFSRKDSLTRHSKVCKIKNRTNKSTTQITKPNIQNNKPNIQNNKPNIQFTNLMNIYEFTKDSYKNLSTKDFLQIIKTENKFWENFIKIINFNPNVPKHHNVYYPDIKSGYGVVFKEGKWTREKISSIINELIDHRIKDLNEIIHNMKNIINSEGIDNVKNAISDAGTYGSKLRKNLLLISNLCYI
nr:C2H2 type zinc finger protein [Mimivirus sp.]URM62527.1 C2H2 type zinc finger protein [Mimivirus sp.]